MQIFFRMVLMLLLAASGLVECSQELQKNEEANETAIRNVVRSYQEAYNQQDAKKMAAQWASDITYTNPVTGESAKGREEMEKLFKEKFADNKKRHLEIVITSIAFPNADRAIENGVMKVTSKNQSEQQLAYRADYIKENGKWLVKALSEIELQQPSSHFQQLKDLAWLIGTWEDSDDNITILFDNQWDKYKNFIVQHFQMKILGQDDIEGKQIIAWDPVKKVIRSWVFDSDGGFGEGTWERGDKSWYAPMLFTLGDGRIGSSINIYTPVDDHSYTFASIEREIDGEILPDMDPVTVKKIK